MNEVTVIIDDDEEEKMHIKTMHVEIAPANETIVLDDDSGSESEDEVQVTNPNANLPNAIKIMSKKEKKFVNMLKGNTLMDNIVKFCLRMENAVGMQRVINKTLLPLYEDASCKLKSSPSFRKLLKQTLKQLKQDPDHKFLHIKTLCENLKSGNIKRKVPFVTLATNLKHKHSVEDKDTEKTNISNISHIDITHEVDNVNVNTYNEQTEGNNKFGSEIRNLRTKITSKTNYCKKRCKRTYGNIMSKRNKSNMINTTEDAEVIDLDNSDNECVSTLVPNQETISNNNEQEREDNSNKENSDTLTNDANSSINVQTNSVDGKLTNVGESDFDLLIPSTYLDITMKEDNRAKILELEEKIGLYKEKIAKLEEAEVYNNSVFSPYVQCNSFKLKLLQCYKELSKLNGCSTDIVKRRKIRISVGESRTSGPAKLLEKRLNNSIDNTGTVAFPDFCDVVECVVQSNIDDNHGWSKQEIFKRATALFRCCGEALRKNRQKREYQDLLGWVPQMEQMEDPAEKDPRLRATLEENKLIAQAKEQEIITKYVHKENRLFSRPMEFELHQASSDSESENTETPNSKNDNSQGITETINQGSLGKLLVVDGYNSLSNIRSIVSCLSDKSVPNHDSVTEHKTDDVSKFSNSSVCNESITNILQNNSKIDSYMVIMNNPTECPPSKTVLQDHNPQNDISTLTHGILSDSNLLALPGLIHNDKVEKYVPRIEFTDSDDKARNVESGNCKIKLEPVDVQSMLDELGDGFISTVFDVQDPFLVIEISSDDSSDGDS